MCMLIDNRMPDISRMKDPQQQVNALYQYVFTLVQQINHVLSNLDEENLSETLKNTISELKNVLKTAGQEKPTEHERWPVGSIYLTADAAQNPAKLFGGTWVVIETAASDYCIVWQRKE